MASVGLGDPWMACSTRSSKSSYFATAPSADRFFSNSEMSAPAANASVPAPRKATQRTSGSASNCAMAGGMPRYIAPLIALRFAGWSKMIQPTAPRFSTLSRLASRTVDGRHHAARVPRRPATALRLMEKFLEEAIEELRLLEVDAVAALRQDRKA